VSVRGRLGANAIRYYISRMRAIAPRTGCVRGSVRVSYARPCKDASTLQHPGANQLSIAQPLRVYSMRQRPDAHR
jgi:hypothetical protein